MKHAKPLLLLAAASILWTWPLAISFHDHVPGTPGDNYSFLWNLWWARTALEDRTLAFFHSTYLFNPFGVDLVNHPHTLLQGLVSATLLAKLTVVQAENLYVVVSVFLNAAAAYALVYDVTRRRTPALLAGVAFGDSPYIAAHLFGHFDLLTAWPIPLFALCLRRALMTGRWKPAAAGGLCVAIAAYSAYYYVVYMALFALAYTFAWWDGIGVGAARREDRAGAAFSIRLLAIGVMALDAFVILWILTTGGASLHLAGAEISMRGVQNPMLAMWVLAAIWALARWTIRIRVRRPAPDKFWCGIQALTTTAAGFAILSAPLIVQAFRLALSGRYVSQVYFWRSAPRGVDVASLVGGNPFHPLVGPLVSRLYAAMNLDRIEQVGWLGIAPLVVLLWPKGQWCDRGELRRWTVVLAVFLIWALGPFLTVGGVDLGLPLPETLARFIPLVSNAREPGRAMVVVYLALGMLMALRLAMPEGAWKRPAVQWALIALLAVDYINAPAPLTPLDRPSVYTHLASIDDGSPVIEVPFGIGDGLSTGVGSQDRRILYYATIHGHPLVGGYIGRMPPGVAQAYQAMPVVGNLLRLSNGEEAIREAPAAAVPFRYLVLDTATASPELTAYVHGVLDMDLVASGEGRELYAVQGPKPAESFADAGRVW